MEQNKFPDHTSDLDDVQDENDIDYISDSNSESSLNDYETDSENESDMDIDIQTADNDFTVPDVKANPPKWTEDVESITVPPFHFQGGPTLPDSFSTASNVMEYFKLFLLIH